MHYKNIYKTNLDGMCELATDATLLKKGFVKVISDKLDNGIGLYSVTDVSYDNATLKPINTLSLMISEENNYILKIGETLVKVFVEGKLSKNQKVEIGQNFYIIEDILKTDDKKVKELIVSDVLSKAMVYHYKITNGEEMYYFNLYSSALAITMDRKDFYISNTYGKKEK